MTLQSLAVKNFQSLSDISLTLAPFTVIVGPSSSGKSALVRSLHALTHNRRGTDFISTGERTATITATTERGTVSLTRATAPGDANAYVIVPDYSPEDIGIVTDGSPESAQPQTQRFTKLGGSVPEEVTQFLGIVPNSESFAAQHDKPYLLDESASAVASTLGALTNVNVVFEAAREANRQKTGHSSTLRTRATDLDAIRQRIPEYQALSAQTAAITRAEELLSTATAASHRLARLTQLSETITVTRSAVARLHTAASLSIPDTSPVLTAQQRLDRLTSLILAIRDRTDTLRTTRAQITTTARTAEDTQQEYADKLASLAEDIEQFMQSRSGSTTTVEDISLSQAAEWATEYIVKVLG